MAERKLFEPLSIRKVRIPNRICVPPMVSAWKPRNGEATEWHTAHYRAIAAGGPGLIIVEAACVTESGRLHPGQIGIWDDSFIPGLQRITKAVHEENVPVFLQIHHGGALAFGEDRFAPTGYTARPDMPSRTMTAAEIGEIQRAFVQAGIRAHAAGFDGAELHGCHQYLISEFMNPSVNRRDDVYGREPERFAAEILDALRREVPEDFVIGIRLGAFEPKLEDGLQHAAAMERHGVDYLSISYGCAGEGLTAPENAPAVPADFPFKDVVWAAGEFKKQAGVPVIAVNGIRTPWSARKVLELTGADMAAVGRSILADPAWPKTAKAGGEPGRCLDCTVCQWRFDPEKCPGRRLSLKTDGPSSR